MIFKFSSVGNHISRGYSQHANFVGFATFWHFLQVLLPCGNMLSPWGGGVGGMCILFEICKKTPFQKCMGWGGFTFFSVAQHIGRCTQTWHCTIHLHFYSESLSSSAFPFSGRAGTPLGQTSPCLWTGTYFFNFCQSCNLCAFTGTQPSIRGMAHRPSVVRSTFRCLVNPTLRQGIASLYPDFNNT